MSAIVRLFYEIALLRKGPQDLPASVPLLVATIAAYFAVNAAMSALLPPTAGPWVLQLLLDIAFTLAWYVGLLTLFGRRERFVQTVTAVFGFQMLVAPLWITTAHLLLREPQNNTLLLPVTLLGLVLLGWVLAVNGRIVQAAIEQPLPLSIGIVLLQVFAAQLLLLALFATPR
jgi:hypothetical protein